VCAAYPECNLPPALRERTLPVALVPYGENVSIHDETWSKAYRYTVANGIKVVMMKMNKHLPSHMNIARHRILASYDGQPVTCYGCGDIRYMYQACPKRRGGGTEISDPPFSTWTHVTAKVSHIRCGTEESRTEVTLQRAPNNQSLGYPPMVDDLVNTSTLHLLVGNKITPLDHEVKYSSPRKRTFPRRRWNRY